jgi:hypothetical protein
MEFRSCRRILLSLSVACLLAGYLAGSLSPGEGGFTAPSKRADLDGDGAVRAADLVLMLLL